MKQRDHGLVNLAAIEHAAAGEDDENVGVGHGSLQY
jgi:hypothetical protein